MKVFDTYKSVHGYSMLRTQLNNDYFQDIIDKALDFEVNVEGHRKLLRPDQ